MPVEIKICGLTNLEDAKAALAAGADYLGFVFHPASPRAVDPDGVRRILEATGGAAKAVGVFVNMAPSRVAGMVLRCGLSVAQIHGNEPPDGYEGFPVPVWRSVAMVAGNWSPDPSEWPAARYVVDAHAPGRFGGTGRTADWERAALLARRVPVMLAGGLSPDNVAAAIRQVCPFGVDVSSGVECRPGVKAHESLRRFISAVRSAEGAKTGPPRLSRDE